jgi:hypothetical protein
MENQTNVTPENEEVGPETRLERFKRRQEAHPVVLYLEVDVEDPTFSEFSNTTHAAPLSITGGCQAVMELLLGLLRSGHAELLRDEAGFYVQQSLGLVRTTRRRPVGLSTRFGIDAVRSGTPSILRRTRITVSTTV